MSEAYRTVIEAVQEDELRTLWADLKDLDRRYYEVRKPLDEGAVPYLASEDVGELDHIDMRQREVEREIVNHLYSELDRRFGRKA